MKEQILRDYCCPKRVVELDFQACPLTCPSRSRNVEEGDSRGRGWLWEPGLPSAVSGKTGLHWEGQRGPAAGEPHPDTRIKEAHGKSPFSNSKCSLTIGFWRKECAEFKNECGPLSGCYPQSFIELYADASCTFFLHVEWLWAKRLNTQMHTGQTLIKIEIWPTTCRNQLRKSACDLPARLAGSQTTVSNNWSSKPNNNPQNNEHKTARTWLIKYAPLAIIGAPLNPPPIRAHLELALPPP